MGSTLNGVLGSVNIVCVGGGPAGLYLAILSKIHDSRRTVTVSDRNLAGVTYGWGVVFGEPLLSELFRRDPVSARKIWDASRTWTNQVVIRNGESPVHLGGYGYTIGRQKLLDILTERACSLGVKVEHGRELTDPDQLGDADLIAACDGANSQWRQRHSREFGPTVVMGANKYIWLGTQRLFDDFTFGFEQTDAGWLWFHGYRFDADTSTCIVECSPQTWHGLGLDTMEPAAGIALLERIFARHLNGESLINQLPGHTTSSWLSFTGVTNRSWHHDRVVLLGDAAHTAHFSIGSGTTLALEDAIALAESLRDQDGVPAALQDYQTRRAPAAQELQIQARNSATWFEHLDESLHLPPVDFGFSMLRRRFAETPTADHSPRWRYTMHRATQHTALRQVRRTVTLLRRDVEARGR
jgi:anthraniloyl-CoA monooxygenase